jgi:hypothetical protein
MHNDVSAVPPNEITSTNSQIYREGNNGMTTASGSTGQEKPTAELEAYFRTPPSWT